MWNLFKKSKKKKGDKKMDEHATEFSNQEINNDTVNQIFRGLDAEYAALKQAIAREFGDYEDMLTRERKQATIYKNKVQVRDVMEEILPVLSDMKNDVMDSTDLNELKTVIQNRYKLLFIALFKVGIKIQMHERNQPIAMDEKVNGAGKATTDPNLHQKVACSKKMGCIIRGEEDNPILEDVEIYVCKRASAINSSGEKDDYSPIQKRKTMDEYPMSEVERSNINGEMDTDINLRSIGQRQPAMASKADICYLGEKTIRFEKNIVLKSFTQEILIFQRDQTLDLSTQWRRISIPREKIDRASYTLYLGSTSLVNGFTIGTDLVYRVYKDEANRVWFEFADCDMYSENKKIRLCVN